MTDSWIDTLCSRVELGKASLYGTLSMRENSGLNGSRVGFVRSVGLTFASFVTRASLMGGGEVATRRGVEVEEEDEWGR